MGLDDLHKLHQRRHDSSCRDISYSAMYCVRNIYSYKE